MTTTRIVGGRILTPDAYETGTVAIADDTIESITRSATGNSTGNSTAGGGEHDLVIDADGLIVSPGFIDLQINGGFGLDLLSDPHAMWELGRRLPSHGVTAFLPTFISSPLASTDMALAALRQRPRGYRGAEPLGLHCEGPMLSPARPGTHCPDQLVAPGPHVIRNWTRANGVAMVTIAPELTNALSIASALVNRGVVVAAGHSNASAAEARMGLDAGITVVTHLFNAMAPMGHRDPNLVGVALAETGLVVGLIVDGVHVDPVVVAAVWNAKGPDGLTLVTDAVAAMGRGPGRYELGGRTITADGDCVRNEQGALAGSILTMDQAVRNLVAYSGCDADQALLAATATPAAVIAETGRGRIEPGAVADLVALDEDLEVQFTLCAGRLVYVAETARDRIPAERREGL